MALGALLDAGADVDEVRALVGRARRATGWPLDAETTQRAGLRATRAWSTRPRTVTTHAPSPTWRSLIAAAPLPERVAARALAVFTALAEAEGDLHGTAPADVHFHEVGALDAIVDVVGHLRRPRGPRRRRGAHQPGVGRPRHAVARAHGELPNPAPATLALLATAGIAVTGLASDVELTTPTGAALLAGLAAALRAAAGHDPRGGGLRRRQPRHHRAGPTSCRW